MRAGPQNERLIWSRLIKKTMDDYNALHTFLSRLFFTMFQKFIYKVTKEVRQRKMKVAANPSDC